MTDRELDQLMRRVLVDSIAYDFENNSDQANAFEPSQQHQKQMRTMLKDPLSWTKKKATPMRKKVLKYAAAVFLAFSIGFGGILLVSPTAQAAMTRYFIEWYESHIVYRHSGEDTTEGRPQYEITELPDGYQKTEDDSYRLIVYENADGDMICLNYIYMQQGSANIFLLEDDTTIKVTINGLDGLLFVPKDPEQSKTVTWVDPDINIQFTVIATLEEAELLRLAESVQIKK